MSKELAAAIAANIRAQMARNGLYQFEVGLALGLSQAQISERLRGRVEFRLSEIERLAGLFGCSITDLLAMPSK